MSEFPITENTRISRGANRGLYDQKTIYSILDDAIDITISYVENGLPKAIPNGFVRIDDKLYVHGSVKSHFIHQICNCPKVCLSISLLDGMVLANTAFNHSFNYRGLVIFSTPYQVQEEELKWDVLRAFTDKLLPGRWEDNIKLPTAEEMKATAVVCFPIEEASAKVRQGQPNNPKAEEGRVVWSGYVPLKRSWGSPISHPEVPASVSLPAYLQREALLEMEKTN